MYLDKTYISNLRKSATAYSIGIDYIALSFTKNLNFRGEVSSLNSTNSDTMNLDSSLFASYTVTANKTSNNADVSVHASIDGVSYRLLQIIRTTNNAFHVSGFMKIYGTTFRLIELGEIANIFELLLDIFGQEDYDVLCDSYLSRGDIKLDLFYDDRHTIPNCNKILSSRGGAIQTYNVLGNKLEGMQSQDIKNMILKLAQGSNEYKALRKYMDNDQQLSGWTIGTKSTKNHFIRCYDKVLDIIRKHKWLLYNDYFAYESVWRIETEFRVKELIDSEGKRIKLKELYLLEKLGYAFYFLEFPKVAKKYTYKTNIDYIHAIKPYIVQTQNRLIKLTNNNINPFTLTIHALKYKTNKTDTEVTKQLKEATTLLKDGSITLDYFSNTVYSSANDPPK